MSSKRPLLARATDFLLAVVPAAILAVPAFAQGEAESLSVSFRKSAARVAPALVAIRPLDVTRPLVDVQIPSVGPFRPGDFIPRTVVRTNETDADAIGSGFLIDADRGIVVTTEGVLRGTSQVLVVFADGTERPASQIRRDPRSEVAVLVVDTKGVNPSAAVWGDSSALLPGDWVLAVGSEGGSPPSLSAGIFSAHRHGVGPVGGDLWLETDTRPRAAGLGGPVVNLKGEVVGMSTPFPGRGRGPGAINHVLPASRVRRIAGDLAEFGQVRRGYLGVQIEPVDVFPGAPGAAAGPVVISSVGRGTPADAAGLLPGDRVLSANGRPLTGLGQLQSAVLDTPIGEDLTLLVDRGGQRIEVKTTPGGAARWRESPAVCRARGSCLI